MLEVEGFFWKDIFNDVLCEMEDHASDQYFAFCWQHWNAIIPSAGSPEPCLFYTMQQSCIFPIWRNSCTPKFYGWHHEDSVEASLFFSASARTPSGLAFLFLSLFTKAKISVGINQVHVLKGNLVGNWTCWSLKVSFGCGLHFNKSMYSNNLRPVCTALVLENCHQIAWGPSA